MRQEFVNRVILLRSDHVARIPGLILLHLKILNAIEPQCMRWNQAWRHIWILEHAVLLVVGHVQLLELMLLFFGFIFFFVENSIAEGIIWVCSKSFNFLVGVWTLRIMRHNRELGSVVDHADWMMVVVQLQGGAMFYVWCHWCNGKLLLWTLLIDACKLVSIH